MVLNRIIDTLESNIIFSLFLMGIKSILHNMIFCLISISVVAYYGGLDTKCIYIIFSILSIVDILENPSILKNKNKKIKR